MYDERKEKFSFKSFFLTLLLVVLFIFVLLWLFPNKWDVAKLQSSYDLEQLSVLYDEIFANNVARMKDASISYFTTERLPEKVGDSKKLTLQQMYDLHLILKLKDKNGNACDVNKSYVEMTKYDKEYRLKVNLSCGSEEDYIIVYLGCYSYCENGVCEKRVDTHVATTKITNNNPKEEPKDDPKEDPKEDPDDDPDDDPEDKPVKKYVYEYKLVTNDSTVCSDWSDWQKQSIQATSTVKVEAKLSNEIIKYNTVKVQTGVKKQTVTKQVTEKYISGYVTKLVSTGTKEIQVGTTTQTVTEKVAVGTVEKYSGVGSGTSVPKNTATTKYKVISTDTPDTCSYCTNETKYIWEIYNVETVYDVVTKTKQVPVMKTINVYENQSVPVYDFRVVDKKETVETPIYGEKKVPVYGDVSYYRSQTCKVVKGTSDIKWSSSNLDSTLMGKGYKLTGNVKEA